MGGKYWRITNEQEFYKKAEKYVQKHIVRFMDTVDNTIKDRKKARNIWSRYNAYKSIPSSYAHEKIAAGLSVVLEDIQDWRSFSSDADSPLDEIMLRALINRIFNCNYVCIVFTSVNKHLTEEFIDDMIYVSSYLFKFEDWDDEHVEAVSSCAARRCRPDKSKELIKLYGKENLISKPIVIKFDFAKINPIGKSKHFLDKYFKIASESTNKKINENNWYGLEV